MHTNFVHTQLPKAIVFFFLIYVNLYTPQIVQAQEQSIVPTGVLDGWLIYSGDDSNIYYLETGIRQAVTSNATFESGYFGPTFSPTGQHVAFCQSDPEINSVNLYVANIDNLTPRFVAKAFNCEYDWSPNGRYLLFGRPSQIDWTTDTWTDASGIWRADISSGATVELIPSPKSLPLKRPLWSPDGKWILYEEVHYIEGSGNILAWNQETNTSRSTPIVGSSAWSPDGQMLVSDEIFYVGQMGMGLYLVEPNANFSRRLLYRHPSYYAGYPQFSPDGTQVAFFRGTHLAYDQERLMVVNLNGTMAANLDFRIYSLEKWLPGGREMLIRHPKGAQTALSVYNLSTASLTTLVESVGFGADWMPAPPKYRILGSVRDPNGNGIGGVRIMTNAGHMATTRESGDFELSGLPEGNYTLTPYKEGYTFGPAVLNVFLNRDIDGQDFLGTDKPPVVFVHGWNGIGLDPECEQVDPDAYFHSVDDLIRDAGYFVHYAYLESSPCQTPTLLANVPRLELAIRQAIFATGQPKVVLVAHSMGGLVSRAYIEGPRYRDDVLKLFTFGSPHQGVPHDVLLFLLNGATLGQVCKTQTAACDFTELGMALFNRQHKHNSDVEYHLITGDAPFWSRNYKGKGTWALILGGDDGIVPTRSGIGAEGLMDRAVTDELHSMIFGDSTYFTREDGWSVSYTECLEFVLVHQASPYCGVWSGSDQFVHLSEQTAEDWATSPLSRGSIDRSEIITHTQYIPGGEAHFVATWEADALEFRLQSPTGDVITPRTAEYNSAPIEFGADETGAFYAIDQAEPGKWQLVLDATAADQESRSYLMFVAFTTEAEFTLSLDKAWYRPGDTVVITGALSLDVDAPTLTGLARFADSSAILPTIEFLDSHQWRFTFEAPYVSGYAEFEAQAIFTDTHGGRIQLGQSQALQIAAPDYQLLDLYQDRLVTTQTKRPGFADLEVSVAIVATQPGPVVLSAELVDVKGTPIAHTLTLELVHPGMRPIQLRFEGRDIYDSRTDGPYTVANVTLVDLRDAALLADQADAPHQTADYAYEEFRVPVIYMPNVYR